MAGSNELCGLDVITEICKKEHIRGNAEILKQLLAEFCEAPVTVLVDNSDVNDLGGGVYEIDVVSDPRDGYIAITEDLTFYEFDGTAWTLKFAGLGGFIASASDNGDDTYTFTSFDGNTNFTITIPILSVEAGPGIDVDVSDPKRPSVGLDQASQDSLDLADSAVQPGDDVSGLTNDAGYVNKIEAINRVFSDVDTLKLSEGLKDGEIVYLEGYHPGIKGSGDGLLYWDEDSVEVDNGGTIFQVTGVSTGRWRRIKKTYIDVRDFGARGDGITDDTQAFNLAINSLPKTGLPNGWGMGTIVVPKGVFLVNGTIQVTASPIGVRWVGESEHATVLKRTNDEGVLFNLSTYISYSIELMSIRHETVTDPSTWTNTIIQLQGLGGGRNLVLDRVFTNKFDTVIKDIGTVNGDTNYISRSTFYNCNTFLDSENSQGIINEYRDVTWGGNINQVFYVAGHWQTSVYNGNCVIDGVFIKYKNISGKYNPRGFSLFNTKFEFTPAHSVANTVPKIIEADGNFIQVYAEFTNCSITGGATPHPDTKLFVLSSARVGITINGGVWEGLWELKQSASYITSAGNYIEINNAQIWNPEDWISDETGLSGRRLPPISFNNVTLATSYNRPPINLVLSKFGPPYINSYKCSSMGRPNQAVSSFLNDSVSDFEVLFYGQKVLINKIIWKYQRGSIGDTGRLAEVYSDSGRTSLIHSFEIPDTATNQDVFVLPVSDVVVEGLYFRVIMPPGTSTMVGHFTYCYSSV